MAATVGTGNIVGVATAIKAGGPGALFWMWMAAFFGMATKYAEGVLAVKYRTVDANGNISGGPMHYIEQGLGKKYKPLAVMFSVFGVMVACLGSGTFTQVNAIVEITNLSIGIPVMYTAAILTVLVAIVTIGGLKSIAMVAGKIVPFLALVYMLTTAAVLIVFADQVPAAFALIIVQIMIVSIKVPVIDTSPCSAGHFVFAAAATIGALPKPASLEKIPRAIPLRIASITVAPKNSAIYGVSLYAYYSGSTDRICRSGTCSICSYH